MHWLIALEESISCDQMWRLYLYQMQIPSNQVIEEEESFYNKNAR